MATIAPADSGDGAQQGIWLMPGAQLPDDLWAAMCGQKPWADPDWTHDEPRADASGAPHVPNTQSAPATQATPGDGAPGGADEVPVVAGFGQGGALDSLGPGPELALLLKDASDLGGLGDDELTGALRGWRRLGSWAAAMEHAAVAELATRRMSVARLAEGWVSEAERFAAAEVSAALTLTRCAAEGLVGRALALADLPGTAAALAAGVIDVPKALVLVTGTAGLDDELARRVEAEVLPKAWKQTAGELRQAVGRAVAAVDPAAAQRRHDAAVKTARVERWAEAAGTGALAGRDLPAADALAADNRVNALAAALKADGAAGGMDFLRAQVFIGLLLGRPVAAPAEPAALPGEAVAEAADGAGPDGAGSGGDTAADGGAGGVAACDADPVPGAPAGLARASAGPPAPAMSALANGWGRLCGSINLTLPLATLLGEGGAPGEVAGFGPVPAAAAAQLAAAGWDSPAMRWCVTVTDADGRAVGHGCATRRPRATGAPASPTATGHGSGDAAGGGWAFTVTVAALAAGQCDHAREAAGYVSPPSLRHLIEIRDRTCSFPGCRRPARQCDLDHTRAYDRGGRSCECNLAPLCRLHHKIKQARGWRLTQPEPGVLQWTTPSGWRYTVTPRGHPT
jgi:hypothetical protein